MNTEAIWALYQRDGYTGVSTREVRGAFEQFFLAILAFRHDDLAGAIDRCRRATNLEPTSLVFTEATQYLERIASDGKQGVYVTGEAFGAFVRGGGNTRLYRAVSAALGSAYREQTRTRLLDVGVGDGLALIPALNEHVASVTVVEPSQQMLAAVEQALASRGVPYDAHPCPIQTFALQHCTNTWDLAQATFSLQSLEPQEREHALSWLRLAAPRLLLAEFDVPSFASIEAPDHVRYVVNHYERGLAEYRGDDHLVASGFLMPVMFGYFDRTSTRTNYEQPIRVWVDELRRAGFAHVTLTMLDDYWWAPAYLLDAL
jgi:hypothetical protein